nr:MAG TPA: hypothetical protein [Caudoviricetes sp.]
MTDLAIPAQSNNKITVLIRKSVDFFVILLYNINIFVECYSFLLQSFLIVLYAFNYTILPRYNSVAVGRLGY